jgi:hypothetical protein
MVMTMADAPSETTKRCIKCGEEKPLEAFPKHSSTRDRRDVWCKACRSTYSAAKYASIKAEKAGGTFVFPDEKTCRRCDRLLAGGDFSLNPGKRDGLASYCKSCASWLEAERKYGLPQADLEAMLARQDGRCAVSGCPAGPITFDDRRTHVDHDHVTGKVRGILCLWCNSALGTAKESIDRLIGLAEYVLHHRSQTPPPAPGDTASTTETPFTYESNDDA